MIDAVIFDMDGLLIDSEPSWVAAEIAVFATVGIELTPEICERTTGLRIDAVTEYWYERYPWTNKSREQVAAEIIDKVVESLQHVQPLPGVRQVMDEARARGLKLAICSSSPYRLIDQVVESLGLGNIMRHSGEEERFGKPHPAAYIATADKLGVAYSRCLVFEDSLNGAIAGKAAGMQVVAVPQGAAYESTRFDFCDAKIKSLSEFDDEMFDRF